MVVSSTTVCIWWIQSGIRQKSTSTIPSWRKPVPLCSTGCVRHKKHLLTVIGETDRFQTDLPFPELKEKVQGILAEGCNTGDGWLIAAEVIQYVEKGCGSVLILHPFGCLVSHVCERGILQRLHARFPDVSIQTIEYDYDQSKTLRESRILLAIS